MKTMLLTALITLTSCATVRESRPQQSRLKMMSPDHVLVMSEERPKILEIMAFQKNQLNVTNFRHHKEMN